MKIPARFAAALAKDQGLNGLVLKALSLVEPWASDNKTVFFPEYTDHSLKHLEEVLLTAEGLILDEAWLHITPEDAAITILAIMLHDCALHLSEDGFYALISGRYQPDQGRYVQEEVPWALLWENFVAEAKRFDQRRLYSLFGEGVPIGPIPEKKLELTYKHRLLIGEFLRRHHARLAHEIALSGIPGPENPLFLTDGSHRDLIDLAGFVARSHNLGLREAVDCLEPQKRRVHLNCKVPFVMATLRIADYLQIHAARAPGELLQLRTLTSPVSRGEWKKHSSVREINQAHDDPEAIFVDADPESAKTFLAMKRLLGDIQFELDQCWAVLGEVYGRFAPLSSLGISIRRLRSNLDNSREFEETRKPPFIPRDFRFKTASAELMDLLVAPLYGAKPEIGIRELVQNAVDACLEREDLIAKGLAPQITGPTDQVTVLIEQTEGQYVLTVEDHGVGMTPDIVDKYFLNVGASFRSSDLWRKNHEADGHATIHRTGRFGVGLLAAFLLGPEIQVTTRHFNAPENGAITFVCAQGNETLEVRHCGFHVGTQIKIRLSKETVEALLENTDKWDWYCLTHPAVKRVIRDESDQHELQQEHTVPACDANVEGSVWRRISAEGFDDVLWTYEAFERWNMPDDLVICNGIYICHAGSKTVPPVSPTLGEIYVHPPSLVVYDPDGRFPINLQRNGISAEHISFARELAVDISNYLAKRLVDAFERLTPTISADNIALSLDPKIPGLEQRYRTAAQTAYIVLSKSGIVPVDADLIGEAGISSILLDATNLSSNRGAFRSRTIRDWVEYYCAVPAISQTKSSRTQFLRASVGDSTDYGDVGYFAGMNIVGRRILVRKSDVAEVVRPGWVPRTLWKRLVMERDLGDWAMWAFGEVPEMTLDLASAIAELDQHESFGFTLIYFGPVTSTTANLQDPEGSPFATAWKQLVGSAMLHQRRS